MMKHLINFRFKLIDELQKMGLELENNNKKIMETHKIFSKETLKLIDTIKKKKNFLKNSFIQKCFLYK